MVRLVLFIMVFFFSCKSADLILPLRDLDAGMRLDGYYYRHYIHSTGDPTPSTNIIFLYKNGVVFDCYNVGSHDFDVMDGYVRRIFGGKMTSQMIG